MRASKLAAAATLLVPLLAISPAHADWTGKGEAGLVIFAEMISVVRRSWSSLIATLSAQDKAASWAAAVLGASVAIFS